MTTHITTSSGLISAAFIENVRQPGSRQRGVEPVSFALPWSLPPKSPAALEEEIAVAWELLLERWDAVRTDLPMMDAPYARLCGLTREGFSERFELPNALDNKCTYWCQNINLWYNMVADDADRAGKKGR